MIAAETLNDLLAKLAVGPGRITYVEGEHDSHDVGFAELRERALGILHHLQRRGARRGDRLILLLPHNEPFIDVFWAALLGGLVPVPVAVGISDEHRAKLLRIAARLKDPWICTERRPFERLGSYAAAHGAQALYEGLGRRCLAIDELDDLSRAGEPARVGPDDIAFIQFSSGSTSEPKGVVLTHANILANARGVAAVARFTPADVSLSWMPLTHDMGLIGFHLFMAASGIHAHLMPTELFIRRPLLWLELASRVRASVLCSPNFGYRHYLKVMGERPVDGLDLSRVRLIFNGAEPISASLCREFLARLEPARLDANAMYPVYGLAEASLAVSFPEPGAPLRTLTLNRHRMGAGSPVVLVEPGTRDAVEIVSEGRAIPNCEVRIATDTDQPAAQGHIGHVQMRGANVTRGYFEDPAANAAAFTADGWMRTGDLGLIHEGALHISGRAKEIIFVNGQNYYPHDLESIAQRVPGLELGKVVAAGVRLPGAEIEELVLFVLHRGAIADFVPTAAAATRLLNEETGLEVARVVPVKRIPKTTSGKVQRHLLEEALVAGAFAAELEELGRLGAGTRGPAGAGRNEIESKLKAICDAALPGKNLGPEDNLFEVGASSLKLIEIHERIDHEYPGQIDLTELFDHPTIVELARHIENKLAAAAGS